MMRMRLAIVLLAFSALTCAAGPPSASISNGTIDAELWLPDPDDGYYRGARFDWSGAISRLTYQGHEYFGEWQDSDDPYLHDHITGPVEEYRPAGDLLGYETAAVGGKFLRIGVGVLRKPEEEGFNWRGKYEMVDPGERTVTRGENWIEMTHEVSEPESGYGYRLTKRLTLTPGKPQMVIDHFLVNTGKKTIDTTVYNHNFFVIDGRPTGPEFLVEFPFEPKPRQDFRGYAEAKGREIAYAKALPPGGESIFSEVDGFGPTAADNGFRIENRETGAGVRVSGDRPLHSLNYWSPRRTLCPEPYIAVKVAPGQADRWAITYEFYEAR